MIGKSDCLRPLRVRNAEDPDIATFRKTIFDCSYCCCSTGGEGKVLNVYTELRPTEAKVEKFISEPRGFFAFGFCGRR